MEPDYSNKGTVAKILAHAVAWIYFAVNFGFKPTNYVILHHDQEGKDVDGLYLHEREWWGWKRTSYKLYPAADGQYCYYRNGERVSILPEQVR